MSVPFGVGWFPIERELDETELLGGAVGGVHRDEVPQIVANLLETSEEPIEITARPESLPDGHHYTVEWHFLVFSRETMEWQRLRNRRQDDE